MAKAAKPKKEITMEEALWKSADKLRGSRMQCSVSRTFYIMRLLWLHPKALPDSKLQQGVYCRLPDGIAQNYNCKYIFRWLLLLP